MMPTSRLVHSVLLIAWILILSWQAIEHYRVRERARSGLINQAKDISQTLGVLLHSQRRFGGVISRERLESALNALLRPGELTGVTLLSARGEVIAAAGNSTGLDSKDVLSTAEHWTQNAVTLINPVDLGTSLTPEPDDNRPAIVLPQNEIRPPFSTNRSGGPFRPDASTNRPPQNPPPGSPLTSDGPSTGARARAWARQRPFEGRPVFGRPPWMSEEAFKALQEKQGVHSFAITLPTAGLQSELQRDLWLRCLVAALAAIAAAGLGWAWRNLLHSSELEVRLARTAELNTRLKEMNLAAAGLAHETKNPLNIIRGLAQMISRRDDGSPQIQQMSRDIVDQSDQVTGQLNEFINYSRPREPRRAQLALDAVVSEVVRALNFDLEEKQIQLRSPQSHCTIEADEQLLRQALFNLLLNAIQAVPPGGAIEISAEPESADALQLNITDNGPGVAPEHRAEIFKPYFTTHDKGTGLGLAVVQQIMLAHGWDIAYLPCQPSGAHFRISGIRVVRPPSPTSPPR